MRGARSNIASQPGSPFASTALCGLRSYQPPLRQGAVGCCAGVEWLVPGFPHARALAIRRQNDSPEPSFNFTGALTLPVATSLSSPRQRRAPRSPNARSLMNPPWPGSSLSSQGADLGAALAIRPHARSGDRGITVQARELPTVVRPKRHG